MFFVFDWKVLATYVYIHIQSTEIFDTPMTSKDLRKMGRIIKLIHGVFCRIVELGCWCSINYLREVSPPPGLCRRVSSQPKMKRIPSNMYPSYYDRAYRVVSFFLQYTVYSPKVGFTV